jgi:hypothetical protein
VESQTFPESAEITAETVVFGRGEWESNPPGTPLRRPPTVLKTAAVTGPHTPPCLERSEGTHLLMQHLLQLAGYTTHALLHVLAALQGISMPYGQHLLQSHLAN